MPPQEDKSKKRIETKDDVEAIAQDIQKAIKEESWSGKIVRHPVAGGLYLEISAAGGLHWRMKYRFSGKEKRLSLGGWPSVSLAKARTLRDKARVQLADGIDPGEKKKEGKAEKTAPTFRDVALAFVKKQREIWAPSHTRTVEGRLNLDVFPAFGNALITEVLAQDVFAMLQKIEERRAFETASRVLGFCSLIFDYAISTGIISFNPCPALRRALTPYNKGQLAAITEPKAVGALMLSIDDYKGSMVVRSVLLFSALTFCRPGEIRHAEWAEIDFTEEMWTIPAEKMKGREEHKVPLSKQALDVLNNIKPYTGNGKYVFPTPRSANRPLSENGVLTALRNMGYTKDQMTAHGFRSMASTLLNEKLEYHPDVIEAQLAHKGADRIRAVYNRAEYMRKRKELMQGWADYLNELKDKVVME